MENRTENLLKMLSQTEEGQQLADFFTKSRISLVFDPEISGAALSFNKASRIPRDTEQGREILLNPNVDDKTLVAALEREIGMAYKLMTKP